MSDGVLVVSSVVNFYNSILPLLKKTGCSNTVHAVSIADARRILMTNDITSVIINCPLNDGFGIDFATELAIKKTYAILIFVSHEFFERATEKCSELPLLLLSKPTSSDVISNTLPLLLGTAKKLSSIDKKAPDSDNKAELLRLLGHAKLILISSFGMSEEQSHKYIERRAMEARKTKNEIAQSIITAYSNR
ncbi:MAG: ANTAR domain-containing protein [Ruminococcaceae bacterium]|nr:ANTAR domain-containing protein [Oscillospiraceae bacterium]